MPNSEITNEAKSKQPAGSSKRKRKQAIKRNIVKEEETTSCNSMRGCKVEKTYGKRMRSCRGKVAKESEEEKMKLDCRTDESVCQSDPNIVNANEDELYIPVGENEQRDASALDADENEDCEEDSSGVSKCSSNKSQCQNCKFCSEHREGKQDSDKRVKKKFPCEICAKEGSPKVYNSLEKHKHHMATVHEIFGKEVKRFECTECPERVWFPTKSKFTYHLGTKHPGIIKFVCEVCTETFKLKANYKNHMKTHNIVVQKKFACDVCNGTFVNKAGFEAHKKRFPGPHIKQSCSHCGFSFSREKHLINHRCKTLLLEEAAARANALNNVELSQSVSQEDSLKLTSGDVSVKNDETLVYLEKKDTDEPVVTTDSDLTQKKAADVESQTNKRVVLHRIISRKNQEPAVYRPVQVTNQTVPESVVVQELREIDFENGTFIAAAGGPGGEQEQQFIVRDVNGHLVQGNQILQLDLNDIQPGEESQVYLADWNIVTPYVIREKSP